MPTYLSPGVYVEEVDRGSKPIEAVGTAVAAFVGFTERAPRDEVSGEPDNRPRRVTNWSQYERDYGGFVPGAMLPHAVYGFFNNGGGSAWIVRVPTEGTPGESATQTVAAQGHDDVEALRVSALQAQPIEFRVESSSGAATRSSSRKKSNDDEPQDSDSEDGTAQRSRTSAEKLATFTLTVTSADNQRENHPDLTLAAGARNVETVVNARSQLVRVEAFVPSQLSPSEQLPASGSYRLEPPTAAAVQVTGADFEGSQRERSGIRGLTIAEDVTMVAVPDLTTAATRNGSVDREMFKAVQTALITHCELSGSRMAILDAPPELDPQEVEEWRSGDAMYDSPFATLYWPWLNVANPLAGAGDNGSTTLSVPPSGHVAGVWARTDAVRGVWKAPANEIVRGALGVAMQVTKGEQDALNPKGVNCIRSFGTRGIRVWGARTLSSDPSWRYVNVRRLFNFVKESILAGTQWVVFEPNDLDLWQRVRRTLNAFLTGLWRQGALAGATAAEAFYVKCDAETNPPESVDEGKLIVEVGLAPVKPAEFVVFRLSQWQGGSEMSEA